jgi:hypothetical protein
MELKRIELTISADDENVAYFKLPDHPGHGVQGIVAKQLRLRDLCGSYKGPDIFLDFDKKDCLIGIEILA